MPLPRVMMVLKVRDEEDILEHTLRFHHALGVERFIVIDHCSSDGSVDVIRRWSEAGLAEWDRREGDYATDVAGWMQAAARRAHELGADWVLHGDADELWLPAGGTIPEALEPIAADYGSVVAPRSEFIGRPGEDAWYERLVIRETRSGIRPKIAHRADPTLVILDRGAHNIASELDDRRPAGGSERAVLRSGHAPGEGAAGVHFTWAPEWPLRIMHFPVRSAEQMRRRTEIYLYEGAHAPGGRTATIRERYESEGIDGIYADLLPDEQQVEAGLASGDLIRDSRVAELIAGCPDPLAPGAPPAGSLRAGGDEEAIAAERQALIRDAMRDLSRMNFRVTTSQAQLIERNKQLERRLRRERRLRGQAGGDQA